jgi:hypothetical protein
MELLKNPHGAVKIKIEAHGQIPAPTIVNNHGGPGLRRLHYCLNLSPILHSESSSFRKEKIDSAPIIAIAALEKAISAENEPQAVLCGAAFIQFVANSLRNEDG